MSVVTEPHASRDEVERAFEDLTDAQYLQLESVARRCLGAGRAAIVDDVLNESFERVVDGRRRWNPQKMESFFTLLWGVVRSVADELRKKDGTHTRRRVPEDEAAAAIDKQHGAVTPTPCVIEERERHDGHAALVEEIEALFKDDQEVSVILEGEKEGLSSQEIREMFEMDKKTYDSARKRLRRTLNRVYPNGVEL